MPAVRAQRVALVAGGGQERVAPQPIVVVEVLVTQRQAVEALGQEFRESVVDQTRIAPVAEAAGQLAGQSQAAVHLAQQEHPAVAGERAAGKIGHDFARAQVVKEQRLALTVCRTSSGGWQGHLAQ